MVPQVPAATRRRDPVDRHVLPSARPHQELEQGLRPGRLPAIPVRSSVRPGQGGAQVTGTNLGAPGALVRDRAQAVRAWRRRLSLLSDRGLDAGAGLPGEHAWAGWLAGLAGRTGR